MAKTMWDMISPMIRGLLKHPIATMIISGFILFYLNPAWGEVLFGTRDFVQILLILLIVVSLVNSALRDLGILKG